MHTTPSPRLAWFASGIALILVLHAPRGHADEVNLHDYPSSIGSAAVPSVNVAAGPEQQSTAAAPAAPTGTQSDPASDRAMASAVADGVTTALAISGGAVETNPLVTPTPLGLIGLTGLKLGVVKYAETLPEDEKRLALKSSSALWGGAAINNLLVLMAAPPPFPIIAGLAMGIMTWTQMDARYKEADALAEAKKKSQIAEQVADREPLAETSNTLVLASPFEK